jgi:oxygen-independent coproporphyrinogen-3 oxidase
VKRDSEVLREGGITEINLDLIAGLPEQSRASWEESLDWIERLDPPHVSVYIFEVDEDSRLGKELLAGGARYGAKGVPDEDATAELYKRAAERLAAMGIPRYEISNFAKPGHRSHHNLKYWLLEPYVGFGLDAHSFDGQRRWSNPGDLRAYLAGGREHEVIGTDAGEEHFFVGLRLTDGIAPSREEWVRFAGPIGRWLEAGMLERSDERLRLAPQGLLVSNEILQDFLNV